MKEGSINIFNDNKKLVQNIIKGIIKASKGVYDEGSTIDEIICTINLIKIRIHIDYVDGKAKRRKVICLKLT